MWHIKTWIIRALLGLSVLAAVPAGAAEVIGGDVYEADADATITGAASRDAFVAGFSATLDGQVAGDGHAAGFHVDVDGSVGADLFAVGATVSVRADVGEDLTASGFSVRLSGRTGIEGNARLTGATVRIGAPVAGAVVASGGRITLDAPVEGDVWLTGADIVFGDDARVDGQLVYSAPSRIDVPERVAAADRVRFVQITSPDGFEDWGEGFDWPHRMFWPSVFAMVMGFVVTLAFLGVVAAVLLAFAPGIVQGGQRVAVARPGLSILVGVFGLATLFGLIPVSAMTLVGLPLIPFVGLFIIASWTLAYLLGAYVLALRLATAFGFDPQTNAARIVALGAGLVILAILNFVPLIGWMINLIVMLYGLGAIVLYVLDRLDLRGPAISRQGATGSSSGEPPADARPTGDG